MNSFFVIILSVLLLITLLFNAVNEKKTKNLKIQFGQQIARSEGIHSLRLFEFYQKVTKKDFNLDIIWGFFLGFILFIGFNNKVNNHIFVIIVLIILIGFLFYAIDFIRLKKLYSYESWYEDLDNQLINIIFIWRISQLIFILLGTIYIKLVSINN